MIQLSLRRSRFPSSGAGFLFFYFFWIIVRSSFAAILTLSEVVWRRSIVANASWGGFSPLTSWGC